MSEYVSILERREWTQGDVILAVCQSNPQVTLLTVRYYRTTSSYQIYSVILTTAGEESSRSTSTSTGFGL